MFPMYKRVKLQRFKLQRGRARAGAEWLVHSGEPGVGVLLQRGRARAGAEWCHC